MLGCAVRAAPDSGNGCESVEFPCQPGIVRMRWRGGERWLLASVVVASLVAMVTPATTAGQWLIQWPVFVRWVEQIVR